MTWGCREQEGLCCRRARYEKSTRRFPNSPPKHPETLSEALVFLTKSGGFSTVSVSTCKPQHRLRRDGSVGTKFQVGQNGCMCTAVRMLFCQCATRGSASSNGLVCLTLSRQGSATARSPFSRQCRRPVVAGLAAIMRRILNIQPCKAYEGAHAGVHKAPVRCALV